MTATQPAQPQPGDFGVLATNLGAWSPAALTSRVIRWGTESSVNHAVVCIGDGEIIEAAPGGARIADYDRSYGSDPVVWSTGRIHLEDYTRQRIVENAHDTLGTPYGWLDIAAIAFAQHRGGDLIDENAPLDAQPWAVRRIASLDTLICSQLVDVAYDMADQHLFDDGRIPGLVSPGDLLALLQGIDIAAGLKAA